MWRPSLCSIFFPTTAMPRSESGIGTISLIASGSRDDQRGCCRIVARSGDGTAQGKGSVQRLLTQTAFLLSQTGYQKPRTPHDTVKPDLRSLVLLIHFSARAGTANGAKLSA